VVAGVRAVLVTLTPKAARHVLEYFTAQINNDYTRKAYSWAAPVFLADQRTRPPLPSRVFDERANNARP